MSVVMMCDASAPGAKLSEYWTKNSGANPPFPIYLQESYVGCVVALREMNGYDDSDFYATVWSEDKGFHEIMYASTRGWTYPNGANIDASPELMAKYEAYLAAADAARYARSKAIMDEKKAAELHVGDKVKVVAGRKVPLGVIGYVASIMPNPYDPKNPKVGLQTPDALVYTYWKNLRKEN
jgi:hypothetical protein